MTQNELTTEQLEALNDAVLRDLGHIDVTEDRWYFHRTAITDGEEEDYLTMDYDAFLVENGNEGHYWYENPQVYSIDVLGLYRGENEEKVELTDGKLLAEKIMSYGKDLD